jgi:peptide/nickel transport system substrate-binding protein
MLRNRVIPGGIGLLFVCLSAAVGCRPQPDASGADAVLRIGVGIGQSARDQSVNQIADLLYSEPLLIRGWDGRASARLANSWGWEDGGRALRLHLKQGVQLHNGTPLTSDRVKRLLEKRVQGTGGFAHLVSVAAPDPATVLLTLSQPDVFLLAELTVFKIVDPDAPDNATGPFRLLRREPDVAVERFDGYHGGRTALDGVTVISYDTPRSAWAALMRGEVDAAQEVSRDSVEFIEHSSTVRIYPTIQPFYIPLVLNLRHPALQHVEVRRALNEAVDREGIVARAMRGHGRAASDPIWPLHWAFDSKQAAYAFDPARAMQRLDAAGFVLRPGGSPSAPKTRFSFRCLVLSEDPQFERIAIMIQRQLFEIGVDMQLEPMPLAVLARKAGAGDFDSFLAQANASRTLDNTYSFWSSTAKPKRQDSGYTGADDLLDELRGSIAEADTRRVLAALAQKFHDDPPAVFLAWTEVTRAVDSRFDVNGTASPDPLANIWLWRPVASARRE